MKACIIGFGAMGRHTLDAYKRISVADEIIVVDSNESMQNHMTVEEWEHIDFKTDYREVLSSMHPDIVSIVTMPFSHLDITKDCVQAGVKKILCEKPMATNINDANEMIRLCKSHDVILGINHGKRSCSDFRMLKSKYFPRIGPIKSIYYVCGGGRLGCVGSHIFDICRFLLDDEIVSIFASIDTVYKHDHKKRENVYDPGSHLIAFYSNGCRLLLDVCEDMGVSGYLIFNGSIGRIVIDQVNDKWTMFCRRDKDKNKRLGEYTLPLLEEKLEVPKEDIVAITINMIESVIEGSPLCTGHDGLKAIEPVLAAHVSSAQKTMVSLPLDKKYSTFNVNLS